MSSTSNTSYSKFPKIMVAIDGSEHSLKAAEYALEIAKSFNSQLFAITVTSVPELYRLRQEDILEESKEMADGRAWLENFSHKAKIDNIELKTELINSHRPVDYVILEYAEEKSIDLIVVGTRGRSGFKKLLLGSVASSVVNYAHCPVMIVK
ncbi:MAG TPA: universal stress protein [Nitrososphaeraceae archaeon]|nr:universal stress protein [Nitrososphaeraceae archaeon]